MALNYIWKEGWQTDKAQIFEIPPTYMVDATAQEVQSSRESLAGVLSTENIPPLRAQLPQKEKKKNKMPKATTPTSARQGRRHNPLEDDIVATGILRTKPGKRKSKDADADADRDNFVDSRASRNILRIGRELDEEEEASRPRPSAPAPAGNFGYESRFGDEPEGAEGPVYGDEDEAWGDEDEQVEEIEVDPEDLETYRRFMPDEEDDLLKHGWDRRPAAADGGEQEESVNLADLILQKIAAHEAADARGDVAAPEDNYELPPKVVEAYTK